MPVILEIWRSGKTSYRADVTVDDPYGEAAGFRIARSVVDVPFSRGTLALSSAEPDAFSEQDIDVLQNMAGLLSEGFQRMADLQTLEIRNRELEREVVERRRTEQELLQAKEDAEAANRAKSTFLANMSHELRTPLNAILGFTQLMSRDASQKSEHVESLEIIGRSGEHLLGLINDVLEMSKIEAGQTVLNEDDFDLHQLLDGISSMFRLRADDKGLEFGVEYADDVPQFIRGDQGKLRQVLMNLLGNAIKFTETGQVTLRARSTGSSPPEVHFEVQDSGPGIAPEEQGALFDAFVQTSSGRKLHEGTGLGLPISQQFVRLMGGEIAVQSEVGKGSLFAFDMSVVLTAEGTMARVRPDRRAVGLEPGQSRYRILVVDDEAVNRRLMLGLLTPVGFEVRAAENGREGVDVWRQWRPHLIWMDIRMPVMDGHEASRLIKTAPEGCDTVIIALTASVFEEERASVLSSGCDGLVRKPYREQEIFSAMSEHLGVRFLYEESEEASVRKELGADALAKLPVDWVRQLYDASLRVDAGQISLLLNEIEDEHPDVSSGLSALVDEFRFKDILELAQKDPD